MTELNCENVCLAAMALLDGQEAPLSPELIESHLAQCQNCREEVAQLQALTELLSAQKRRDYTEDVWPAIRPVINQERGADVAGAVARPLARASSSTTLPFVLLGALLLSYKLAEMVPQADLGPLFKIVPVLLVLGVFGYLKENPFRINVSLRLEGE